MSKIKTTSEVPSAREFYDTHYSDDAVVMLRDFARLHVKAALEAVIDRMDDTLAVAEYQKVRNAYPETNIKWVQPLLI